MAKSTITILVIKYFFPFFPPKFSLIFYLRIIGCELNGFIRELWREVGQVPLGFQPRTVRRRNLLPLELKGMGT